MNAVSFLEVQHVLHNAASARRCGTQTSDAEALKEALEEALEAIDDLSDSKDHDLAIEAKDERIAELEDEASCALTADERKAGPSCKNDDCAACRLAWAALEKDCGAADERRAAGLCAASHLGVDRCCECAAHLAKIETDGEIEERDNEIARLTKECDEVCAVTPGKSADAISQLRTDLALATARHEAEIVRVTGLLAHAIAERDTAIVRADSRPVAPAKVKPAKAHNGPSLFDYIKADDPAAPTSVVKPAKRAGVKKWPLKVST